MRVIIKGLPQGAGYALYLCFAKKGSQRMPLLSLSQKQQPLNTLFVNQHQKFQKYCLHKRIQSSLISSYQNLKILDP